MRLFESDFQLTKALRVLSEAGLIDIVAGTDRCPGYRLSAAITNGGAQRPDRARADPGGSRPA